MTQVLPILYSPFSYLVRVVSRKAKGKRDRGQGGRKDKEGLCQVCQACQEGGAGRVSKNSHSSIPLPVPLEQRFIESLVHKAATSVNILDIQCITFMVHGRSMPPSDSLITLLITLGAINGR
jgi:hypothetical protein